jgi:hypothetical protein
MLPLASPFTRQRSAAPVLAGVSALTSSLWIAICAAAPEFIWRGLRIALDHLSMADLLSAVLIGLVLAFFVEPLMERIRHLLQRAQHRDPADYKPRSAFFTAAMSFAFALASVCLHDAMIAFVTGEHTGSRSGLAAGIELTTAWALVPFTITLAWLSVRSPWLALPMGVLAGTSSCIAGWVFSWSVHDVITTSVPCVFILGLGYRQAMRQPSHSAFTRCAATLALVATAWFTIALLLDLCFNAYRIVPIRLYSANDFWVDLRFYLGWILGLILAPFPYDHDLKVDPARSG